MENKANVRASEMSDAKTNDKISPLFALIKWQKKHQRAPEKTKRTQKMHSFLNSADSSRLQKRRKAKNARAFFDASARSQQQQKNDDLRRIFFVANENKTEAQRLFKNGR